MTSHHNSFSLFVNSLKRDLSLLLPDTTRVSLSVACVWRDYESSECDEPPPPAYSSHMSFRNDENVSIINFNFIWMFVIYWISLKLKAYMYWEWYHTTFRNIYIHRNDMTVSCKSLLTISPASFGSANCSEIPGNDYFWWNGIEEHPVEEKEMKYLHSIK